jgi:polyisoprenoid-binding protein YceI
MKIRLTLSSGLGLGLLLLAAAPAAADPASWSGGGETRYVLIHKFHEVEGKSHKVQARAVWDGNQVKVQARALVDSFESGDANRDAHMLEVMEDEKYPFVTVRGVVDDLPAPTGPAKVKAHMKAEVELHGKTVTKDVDLDLDFADPTHVTVTYEFPESLEAHDIERPSLLFVKVNDDITISGTLTLERKP